MSKTKRTLKVLAGEVDRMAMSIATDIQRLEQRMDYQSAKREAIETVLSGGLALVKENEDARGMIGHLLKMQGLLKQALLGCLDAPTAPTYAKSAEYARQVLAAIAKGKAEV